MAVVAIAAIDSGSGVCKGETPPVLRNLLAFFPIANELAIRRPLNGFHVDLFNELGCFFIQGLTECISLTAGFVGFIGVDQGAGFDDALIAKGSLHNLLSECIELSYRGGCCTT